MWCISGQGCPSYRENIKIPAAVCKHLSTKRSCVSRPGGLAYRGESRPGGLSYRDAARPEVSPTRTERASVTVSGRGIYNRDTIAGIFHTRMIMPTSKMRYHTMRFRMRVRLKMGRRGRCSFMFLLFARRSIDVICAITFICVAPSLTLSMTTFSMPCFAGLGG